MRLQGAWKGDRRGGGEHVLDCRVNFPEPSSAAAELVPPRPLATSFQRHDQGSPGAASSTRFLFFSFSFLSAFLSHSSSHGDSCHSKTKTKNSNIESSECWEN